VHDLKSVHFLTDWRFGERR